MNNEYNKKLADQGWAAMRRTLDREMPRRRRRRPLIWWWLLLLPMAAGAGWWWQQRQPAPAETAPGPPHTRPATPPPVPELPAPATPPREQAAAGDRKGSGQQAVTASSSAAKATHRPAGTSAGRTKDVTTSSSAPAFALVPVYPQPGGPVQENNPAGGARDEYSPVGPLQPLPVVISGPVPNAPPSLHLSQADLAAPAVPVRCHHPSRWSFGLSAGLASENFGAVNAWTAGPAVNWQFHRKWGLRSGLYYGQYRLSAGERPVVTLDNTSYVTATGNLDVAQDFLNSPVSGGQQGPLILVPVEKVHRIEMPLLAYWQPTHPLRVFGGASVQYNLSTRASAANFANNKTYFTDTKEALDNLSELTANNLPTWQFGLQTGAGLRLGRHLELNAFYRYDLHGIQIGKKEYDAQGAFTGSGLDVNALQKRNAFQDSYFLFSGIWFF